MDLDNRLTIATPEGVTIDVVIAGLGSRFVARLLDSLIQLAIILALLFGAGIVATGVSTGVAIAVAIVVIFLVVLAYDIPFEVTGVGTPGKRAMGIRVVARGAEPVDFVTSSVRNLLRIIDFIGFYLVGAVSIVSTQHSQRLGDLAAGTLVIRERFGGRKDKPVPIAPITVPLAQVQGWDVTAIDDEELVTVRHFLDRRLALPWPIRSYFAAELVRRLWPKVPGVPHDAHAEFVLEGIVVAKQARA
ncbi:MAG TPA: RDD family protein [Acidimicrobiia bacterium]|nr:RDD family protein [Acidimicrobiia bacterium]